MHVRHRIRLIYPPEPATNLRNKTYSVFDRRDDFKIKDRPPLRNNIPISTAYEVYNSPTLTILKSLPLLLYLCKRGRYLSNKGMSLCFVGEQLVFFLKYSSESTKTKSINICIHFPNSIGWFGVINSAVLLYRFIS